MSNNRGTAFINAIVSAFVGAAISDFLHKSKNWPKDNLITNGLNDDNSKEAVGMLEDFASFGIPANLGVDLYSKFISAPDSRWRIPAYVAWSIPKEETNNMDSSEFNNINQDYFTESEYVPGILVKNEDFISNAHHIIPQHVKSSEYWLRLERMSQSLTCDFDKVHVIAGPAMIPEQLLETNGKLNANHRMMKYLVIGPNQIAVPTHLFKIILAERKIEKEKSEYFAQTFLIPNSEIEKTDSITKYSVSLEELENVTGMKFLHNMDSDSLFPLCRPNELSNNEQSEPTSQKYGCDCSAIFPSWEEISKMEKRD